MTDDRGQRTEDRGQRTEDRRQRTEDRGQSFEFGMRNAERKKEGRNRQQATDELRKKAE